MPKLPGGNGGTVGRSGNGDLPKFPIPGEDGNTTKGDDDDGGNGGLTVGKGDGGITVGGNDDDFENNAHYLKGQDFGDDGKWAQAEQEFVAASKEKPKSAEIWRGLGDARYQQSKWQAAESAHRQAVKLQPGEGLHHANLAADLLKLGRRSEALKSAMQAKKLGLDDHEVYEDLGIAG